MVRRRLPTWNALLRALAWILSLALPPWWMGLSLLLSMVATLLLLERRMTRHAALLRRGLRWGLPGVLLALQRALGGDAFAWGVALLGALAGYTLLVGLEAWLDRKPPRASVAVPSAEWSELAQAPIGPVVEIIELQPPAWQQVTDVLADPQGGRVDYRGGSYRFADDTRIGGVGPDAGFSPDGRWFAVRLRNNRGIVLWDRDRDQQHRLRGWELCGWHRGQPWLNRSVDTMPVALKDVLGEDDTGLPD